MDAAPSIPLLSIILCTRNRAGSLQETLRSLAGLIVPPDCRAELLVVDNGSTDATRTVVAACHPPGFPVRYLYEPQPGLARARNRAVREAGGLILVFIDDDLRIPPDWLEGMCRPILAGTADATQGGVRPAPHLERPWFKGALRTWLAAVEDPVHPPAGLVGANFAVRREAVALTSGFDPRLGAGASGFFEDTMFGWQLLRAGGRIAYHPEVAVEHHFDPDRLTLPAYIRAAHKMAWSHALVIHEGHDRAPANTVGALLAQLPPFLVRCATQLIRYGWGHAPDPGFIVRYYRLCLWFSLRRVKFRPA